VKRRIVIEVDDDLTTAEMVRIGGSEDAFGLTTYVMNQYGDHQSAKQAMSEFGIRIITDEQIG
jgi:hypothetical protein